MAVRVTPADPRQPAGQLLLAEMSAEIAALYPDEDDGGTGGFRVEDVEVPRAVFVIAWDDDAPVGCGALRPLADATMVEVKRMFVRRAARGRKISRQILTDLEERAVEFGYTLIRLETGIQQHEAIALYENCGYQRMIDCYNHYEESAGSICYEKPLR